MSVSSFFNTIKFFVLKEETKCHPKIGQVIEKFYFPSGIFSVRSIVEFKTNQNSIVSCSVCEHILNFHTWNSQQLKPTIFTACCLLLCPLIYPSNFKNCIHPSMKLNCVVIKNNLLCFSDQEKHWGTSKHSLEPTGHDNVLLICPKWVDTVFYHVIMLYIIMLAVAIVSGAHREKQTHILVVLHN